MDTLFFCEFVSFVLSKKHVLVVAMFQVQSFVSKKLVVVLTSTPHGFPGVVS